MHRLAVPVLFCGIIAALLCGCGDEALKLKAGDPAPRFALPRLSGGTARFPEQYRGKVVAVRFWASWCPYCNKEMRDLEPVYQKYRNRGLAVIAVNVHQDREAAQRFIDKLNISYEVVLDTQGKTAARYQVIGIPTTYIIDRKGLVRTKIAGESTAELFEKAMRDLF